MGTTSNFSFDGESLRGATRFLKQHEGFTFRSDALASDRAKVLYDRDSESRGEVEDNEIPF